MQDQRQAGEVRQEVQHSRISVAFDRFDGQQHAEETEADGTIHLGNGRLAPERGAKRCVVVFRTQL